MSLDEIDAFARALKNCPKCGSDEGFWFAASREKSYVQCKYCGAILEICEIFPNIKRVREKGSQPFFDEPKS